MADMCVVLRGQKQMINPDVAHHIIHQLCDIKQMYTLCFQGTMLGRAGFKAPRLREQEFPKRYASVHVVML